MENFGGYDGYNDKFKGTSSTSPMSRRAQNDISAFDPYTYTGYSSNINSFPDITFHGIVQSCSTPTNASVDSLTDISVGIGWTGNNPNFEVDIAQDATALGSGTVFVTSLDSLFTDTLTSVTDYRVYVREICGVGDTSGWLGPITFSTECPSAFTPDYSEEFDAYPTDCWSAFKGLISDSTTVESTTGYWYQDGFGNVSGSSSSAYINIYSNRNDWLISQSIDLGSGQNYQLEFDVVFTAYSHSGPAYPSNDDTLRVLISSDNGVTWSAQNVLDTWDNSTGFPNDSERKLYDLSSYSGVVKFAFYAKSDVSIGSADFNAYIDNFKVNTCTQYISVSDTACVSYTSPYTGNVYSQTGIYSDTVAHASCDSIYTLDITINSHTSASINVIECDTFVSVTGNAYTQTGVYYDTIPNMYSCDSVVQTTLSVLYVDLSADQSQNVYLSSNESDPAASYQWVNCSDSSPISGETSIDFTASALGDYACQISIGSCVQISECISVTSLDSSTSIGQYTKSDIKVYPNPNNGQFTLELSEKPQDKLHLSISNTLGQLIYSKELNSSNNAISLDGVDKGIYIMSLTSPTQSLKTRIVID